MDSEQIYASVDLELSGFDPEVDEIIEIGILTFTMREGVFIVLEKFESLSRPRGDVRNRILGLTGIEQASVMSAPLWEDILPRVQELLAGKVIVGHGVDMDCKFLKANGVSVGAGVIDTLELAQIFLPTHHSYNLENLATTLQVEHISSHRALADAEATYGILEKMLGIFLCLPEETKDKLEKVARSQGFVWCELFSKAYGLKPSALFTDSLSDVTDIDLIDLPHTQDKELLVVNSHAGYTALPNLQLLTTSAVPFIVAFHQRQQVISLAERFGGTPYLGAYEQVSARAIANLIEHPETLSGREAVAVCKVLVWQAQGKGFGILAELNWSIIGTELKKLFVSGFSGHTPAGLALTDLRSVPDFTDRRNLWVDKLDACVEFLEQKSGVQLSWASFIALIKSIGKYQDGAPSVLDAKIAEAMAITDIFFVSTMLLLKHEQHLTNGSIALDDLGLYELNRITQSARNFCEKILALTSGSGAETVLSKLVEQIRKFFTHNLDKGYVRWIEVGDGRCSFIMRAVDLSDSFRLWSKGKEMKVLQTDFHSPGLIAYFEKRLGLGALSVHNLPARQGEIIPVKVKLSVLSADNVGNGGFVVEQLRGKEDVLVIFPTLEELKRFYDLEIGKTELTSPVIAVGIHGGAQKVLRNFYHSKKTIVLAAIPQLITFFGEKLIFKTVLFAGLPHIDINFPYNKELITRYFNEPAEFEHVMRVLAITQTLRVFNLQTVDSFAYITTEEERTLALRVLNEVFMHNLSTVDS